MPINKVESDAEFIYEVGMKFMLFMLFMKSRGIMPNPAPQRNRFHKNKPEPERKKRRDALLRKT